MTVDVKELRKYLLGDLDEAAGNNFDARLFADDQLQRDLESEQDALVEDFVFGRLTADEDELIRAQIARSPLLEEKVNSLRVLLAALQDGSLKRAPAAASFFARMAMMLSPALAVLLCVAAALYVRERDRNAEINARLEALSHVPQAVAESHGNLAVSIAFLSANVVRGISASPVISVPAGDALTELQVELRGSAASADVWEAELLRGGEVVWKSSRIPLRMVGNEKFLPLYVDSKILEPGEYEIRYRPSSPGVGAFQTRTFRAATHS